MAKVFTTISGYISTIAASTGAPAEFVTEVIKLFVKKNISLESPSTPYESAIAEAFRREANIRIRLTENTGEASVKPIYKQAFVILEGRKKQVASITKSDRPLPMVPGPDEVQ